MKTVDCRGLNCPEPVLRTKNAVSEKSGEDLNIIVDNETARENVLRFLRGAGRQANWQEVEGFYHISASGHKAGETGLPAAVTPAQEGLDKVLLITANELGRGSSELGELLMRNFIYTLTQREDPPQSLVLINSGVKLSIESSPAREELEALEQKGVQILVCGTCLDYYTLKDEHRCGEVSNMYAIADLLMSAPGVISI